MFDELHRAVNELLAYTALIPAEFTANKGSFYRYGFNLLQPNFHITSHLPQIRNALEAAKSKKKRTVLRLFVFLQDFIN